MPATNRDRAERGLSSVEYAIIVAAISLIVLIVLALIGNRFTGSMCQTAKALGASSDCPPPGQTITSSPAADTTPPLNGGSGSGAGNGPGGSAANSGGSSGGASGGGAGAPGSSGTAGATDNGAGTPDPVQPSPTNSAGTQVFNTAVIDQDSILSDLSMRVNVGWFPSSWSNVVYPTTMTVDVTWSPALSVDRVVPGNDGTWTWKQASPGHVVLTRTGSFDTSGFQPEPEILLIKPPTSQTVTATFTATTPNTANLTKTASTTSVPYK